MIFVTPIKNIALYGNPLYPIKIEIAGIELNHKAVPQTFNEGDRPQKWVQSILEINTPQWSADQFNYSGNPQNLDRAGGFFGAYVIFNLALLILFTGTILIKKHQNYHRIAKPVIYALVIVVIYSGFVANFPQSHELRYFMSWMILLVSLNLSIISFQARPLTKIKSISFTLIYLIFLAVMCAKIDNYYLQPVFNAVSIPPRGYTSVKQYINDAVKPDLVKMMEPNQVNCMISRHAIPDPEAVPYPSIANAFFYASYFHPEIGYEYSIQAAIEPQDCGDLKIIPPNAADFINVE